MNDVIVTPAPDAQRETQNRDEFEKRLAALLNEFSMENTSDTPDFILARYLVSCLGAFSVGVIDRSNWYGTPSPWTAPPR